MSGLKNLHFYCAQQTFDLALQSVMDVAYPGGHSIVKNTGGGAGSIVWSLGFWLGKIFWGSTKILIWTIVRG